MKILFLTSRLPYPPHQGDKLRNWHFLQYLSREHEIHLLSFYSHEAEKQYLPTLKEVCTSVTLIKLPFAQSLINCMKAVFGRIPFQVAFYQSLRMQTQVELAIEHIKPDIIHSHLMRMAPYVIKFENHPKVLDLTDAVSLYLSRFKQISKNPLLRFIIGKELKRVLEYENIITKFHSTLICSTVDRRILRERYQEARIDLINNSIENNKSFYGRTIKRDPHRIIFMGNMSYPPNSDAVRYFVQDIFPSILKGIPDAKFYIVGKNPKRSIRSLCSKNIIVTGFVDNIEKEYLASSVIVSPVRFGSGALTKVLEPLMLGVPVVSTSVGVEGLQLENGKEIFITDDPAQFAKHVINLIRDPVLWQRTVDSAKKVSQARFEMDIVGRELVHVYEDVKCKHIEMSLK